MSKYAFECESEEDDSFVDFQMELVTDFSEKRMTLVCIAEKKLSPKTYAAALLEFAAHIEKADSLKEIANDLN